MHFRGWEDRVLEGGLNRVLCKTLSTSQQKVGSILQTFRWHKQFFLEIITPNLYFSSRGILEKSTPIPDKNYSYPFLILELGRLSLGTCLNNPPGIPITWTNWSSMTKKPVLGCVVSFSGSGRRQPCILCSLPTVVCPKDTLQYQWLSHQPTVDTGVELDEEGQHVKWAVLVKHDAHRCPSM